MLRESSNKFTWNLSAGSWNVNHFLFFFLFFVPIQLYWTYTCTVNIKKDNVQQNKNYNLKLTKKKPNTTKTLVVTKIKWERNQLSKQNFIPYLKETKKTDHFVLKSFPRPVVQEIYFSRLILSRARETNSLKM